MANIDPPIYALPVERVVAIAELSDLVLRLQPAQADDTRLGLLIDPTPPSRSLDEGRKFHHGELALYDDRRVDCRRSRRERGEMVTVIDQD